jgi:hypothetical protein
MSLYQKFETDRSLEKTGITLDYGLNSKNEPIEIRIARAGGANDAYLKRLEAKAKPVRRQIQHETIERAQLDQIVKEVYAETVVLGWNGVEDRDGNPMEFTKDNVLKLFNDLPDLYLDIQEQATSSAAFRVAVREDDSKN